MVKTNHIKPNALLQEARRHVEFLLTVMLPDGMTFHNLQHTKQVVAAAKEIGRYLQINKQDAEILELAAWFHDTGFIMDYREHEQFSQKLAKKFLQNYDCEDATISKVLDCIYATKRGVTPGNKLETILCDADLYHLSQPGYPEWLGKLRNEWATVLGSVYADSDWKKVNLEFLENHCFRTNYGQEVLEPRKQKVIENYRNSA